MALYGGQWGEVQKRRREKERVRKRERKVKRKKKKRQSEKHIQRIIKQNDFRL